jgi:protein O-GlcNAc transferase
MAQVTIQQTFELAARLHDSGKLKESEQLCRRILAVEPDHADALHLMGVIAHRNGRGAEAVSFMSRAVAIRPDFPEAFYHLGIALKDAGRMDAAIAAFRRAVEINPRFPEALNNLGNALTGKKEIDAAVMALNQALAIRPEFPEALYNLGNALAAKSDLNGAIAAYGRAAALRPDHADTWYNLGIVLRDTDRPDDAEDAYRRSIALRPNFARAHNNLGNALKDQARLTEAIAEYREAMELQPENALLHSNLLYSMQYDDAYDAEALAEEHRVWNQHHAEPLAKLIQPHLNDRAPERRLRIGYVSPDFFSHCLSLFMIPLFSNQDRKSFELYCYSLVRRPDDVTERIRGYVDVWRPILGLSDAEAAAKIREDRIDILMDMTMHMMGSRLLIFAQKPAPVQLAWLAYPGTTGLSTMDYRLTDPYLDPPGVGDHLYSEKSIRLPNTFWCYDPRNSVLTVNPLPAESRGFVTFGCLNNFCKVNEPTVRLWARVLRGVEKSRMVILSPQGSHRKKLLGLFESEGVDAGRIDLVGLRPRPEYLRHYHGIDIGLDTLPYNGHTTSLDSYWMGVPVVTRVGNTIVGRAGLSQLSNLGLTELVTHTPEEFVRIAVQLANNLPRLAQMRRELRARMEASPLMDRKKFARDVEAVYRQIWRNLCAGGGTVNPA